MFRQVDIFDLYTLFPSMYSNNNNIRVERKFVANWKLAPWSVWTY